MSCRRDDIYYAAEMMLAMLIYGHIRLRSRVTPERERAMSAALFTMREELCHARNSDAMRRADTARVSGALCYVDVAERRDMAMKRQAQALRALMARRGRVMP